MAYYGRDYFWRRQADMYNIPAYTYQQGTTAQGEPIVVAVQQMPGALCQYCQTNNVREIWNMLPTMCLMVMVFTTLPFGLCYLFLLSRCKTYWCANCRRAQEDRSPSPIILYVLGSLMILIVVVVFVLVLFVYNPRRKRN